MNTLSLVRILVVCSSILPTTSCVDLEDGDHGVTLAPSHWSTHAGAKRRFSATVPGAPSNAVTFQLSIGAGVAPVSTGDTSSIFLISTADAGTFFLRATSVDDPGLYSIATIDVVDRNYGLARTFPINFGNGDEIFGSVAVGGPDPVPPPTALGAGTKVYVGTIQGTENRVRRFDFDQLLQGNFTAEYDSQLNPGQQEAFYMGVPRPRLAADGAGNGYWVAGNWDGFALGGISAGQAQTSFVEFVAEQNLGCMILRDTDIAADAAGNVYVLRLIGGKGDSPSEGTTFVQVVRISDYFGNRLTTFLPIVALPDVDYALAVDSESRVLLARGGFLERYLPDGTVDMTFVPGLSAAEYVIDLDVDGEGVVYATTRVGAGTTGTRIVVMNDLGEVVERVNTNPAVDDPFDAILGAGVSPGGTIALIDDLLNEPTDPSTAQGATFVFVEPGPLLDD